MAVVEFVLLEPRIESEPAHTRIFTAFCECGGKLKYVGLMKSSNPPWYVHKCETCGKRYDMGDVYPKAVVQPAPA